jgi:hypothetical protein
VIPTVILLGLIFGHWWKTTLVVAAVGWPLLLIVTGVDSGLNFALGAAALAMANAAFGILGHRLLWLLARGMTSAGRKLSG